MDLSEKDRFGLEKRNENHLSYNNPNLSSDWQFNHQAIENPMNSSSSCPSISMVDSFCSNLYNQPSNTQNPIEKSIPMGWNPGILPASLAHFPADSSFIERAARFSCFTGGNFNAIVNNLFTSNETLSPMNDQRDNKGSNNESGEAELSGDGHENSSSKGSGSKKRKRTNKDLELEQVQGASPLSIENTKENAEAKKKSEETSSTMASVKPSGKKSKYVSDGPKDDYIHVRARRGQATNSHSLAERVRREKISERMKFLQDLVPGCSKVTGKAVMLDEIINYVQSLQQQVEFLSMKLATVNPRLDFNIEGLLSKDLLQLRGGSSLAIGFSPESIHPQLHNPQQGLVQAGISGMRNPSDELRREINSQLASTGGYKQPLHQMPNAWEDELHNVLQMNFGSNPQYNSQELNVKPRDGFPL